MTSSERPWEEFLKEEDTEKELKIWVQSGQGIRSMFDFIIHNCDNVVQCIDIILDTLFIQWEYHIKTGR